MSFRSNSSSLRGRPRGERVIARPIRTRNLLAHALAWVVAVSTVGAAGATPASAAPLFAPAGTPGIDVSHWQGEIDWSAVASSGVRFAIAKATDGRDYVDITYLTNKTGAEANGIAFGAYHFARPDDSPGDAVAEADHFVDTAQLVGGNLIPVLDLERTGGLSHDELTAWMLAWLGRVTERTGAKPMVYTSPSGWASRTGDTTAIAAAGYTVLWVAHWDTATPTVPAQDWAGHGWTFWQYSDCGTVPGISGCVDLDTFALGSFASVTVPGADTDPPGVALSTPVGGPVTLAFDERVRGVTGDNIFLWTPGTGTYPRTDLTCANVGGDEVDCVTGRVRSVLLEPREPLALGERYEVVVNPALVMSAVADRAGNPVPTTTQALLSPTAADDADGFVSFAWPTRERTVALGGSYVVERTTGTAASFAFEGSAVAWYTATGPAQGKASVWIDGERVAIVDGYAPRTTFGVVRRFGDLAPGEHVISVRPLGRGARPATDTQVVVDAFAVDGVVRRTPELDVTWRRLGDASVSGTARASATVAFSGTGIDWSTATGPEHGIARLYVDDVLVQEVDNRSEVVQSVVRSITDLAPGAHTLRIVVAGDGLVSIDGFTVQP